MQIFRVSPTYRSATVWKADAGGRLIATTTISTLPGLDRRDRYCVLRKELRARGIRIPGYSEK